MTADRAATSVPAVAEGKAAAAGTTPRIGSLCSGYGGLDMALEAFTGGRTVWHVEHDKHPSAILAHRFPGVPNHGDVMHTDWTSVEPVDWLTAGYPCQPFSLAGLRKGADDPRHLWPGVADAIGVLRPRHVLLENVAAHLGLGFDVVLADLAALGYDARWGVVRASDAGAPHGRARLFVVATDTQGNTWGKRNGDGVPAGIGRGDARAADADAPAQRRGRAEGQFGRLGAAGLLTDTAADTDDIGHEWQRLSRGRRSGPTDSGGIASDTAGDGRREGRTESARVERRPDAALGGLSVATYPDGAGLRQHAGGPPSEEAWTHAGHEPASHRGPRPAVEWGAYGAAIRRWECVLGRPAPRPTEPGRNGERLSPRFVEWLMGLPDGWVTDVPRLPRNAQLKGLGNGAVPQQADLALQVLHPHEAAA